MTKLIRYRSTVQQIRLLEKRLVRLRAQGQQWSLARLLLFLATVFFSAAALFTWGQLYFWLALLVFGAAFIGVVLIHQRLEGWILRFETLQQIKMMQRARLTLNWSALPKPLESADFSHPYEGDLDLVGPRSILRLIDLSITDNGRTRLRGWLTSRSPQAKEILHRQRLVQELVPKHLLRMQLLVKGQLAAKTINPDEEEANRRWDSAELEQWMSQRTTQPFLRYFLWAGWALAAVNIILLGANQLFGAPPLWLYSGAVYVILLFLANFVGQAGPKSGDIFTEAMRLREPFEQLVALFAQLENYRYQKMPAFQELCAPFLDEDHSPSRYLKRLVRIINATGLRGNPLVWMALNLLAPWDLHFTWQLDRCKAEIDGYLPRWLDTWAEIEALCALANLAYLNPAYTFPEIVATLASSANERHASVTFEAKGIGHPLLPDLVENPVEADPPGEPTSGQVALSGLSAQVEPKVTNNFSFEHLGDVRLLTGSNMSGKSTFLRTLGVNMAMAYAGGPVNAEQLQLQRFRLFSSIRVTDSVTDGISYFYAEVKRLRGLLDALQDGHELPVFFLIDEIYRGTNNRERLIGSQAYIKALAGMKGVGLISTHDLDLVTLADDVPQIQNYHFRDDVVGERMIFDYLLRPGPCPTTNALKIMGLEGLPNGVDPIIHSRGTM